MLVPLLGLLLTAAAASALGVLVLWATRRPGLRVETLVGFVVGAHAGMVAYGSVWSALTSPGPPVLGGSMWPFLAGAGVVSAAAGWAGAAVVARMRPESASLSN